MNNIGILSDFVISILFIFSLRELVFPRSAYRSNVLGICGMLAAIIVSLFFSAKFLLSITAIGVGACVGIYIAKKIKMTSLPETIAAFNGLGGFAAFLISYCNVINFPAINTDAFISAIIGVFTFSGSFIAFMKLHGLIKDNIILRTQMLNVILLMMLIMLSVYYIVYPSIYNFMFLSVVAFLFGVTIVLRVGGADMPIVISLLNAGSGFASAAVGFSVGNILLIITGALVGTGGGILSYIMSKAMNRSLINIFLNTPQNINKVSSDTSKHINSGTPSEAAFIMENANKVIIVPGYGMAAAQAQHSIKQMAELLIQKYNVDVKFAVHPVAGRMRGHMNVLLAEAGVPYENIYDLSQINHEFSSTDVVYVIGANDIINPLAQNDKSSPIYGMPILEVSKANTIFIVKRSLATGYSGVDNPLFYDDKTIMLFGDAQKITAEVVANLEY